MRLKRNILRMHGTARILPRRSPLCGLTSRSYAHTQGAKSVSRQQLNDAISSAIHNAFDDHQTVRGMFLRDSQLSTSQLLQTCSSFVPSAAS